jgi:hypothetical protein
VAVTRKRLFLVFAALAALGVVGTWVLWPRPSRITEANYRLVRDGLTRHAVEEVLGPPGDHRTRLCHFTGMQGGGCPTKEAMACQVEWRGDGGRVLVWFDASGRSRGKAYGRPKVVEQPPLE